MEKLTVSRATRLAYAENKKDRVELFNWRSKWQKMNVSLKRRGIYLAELEKEQIEDDSLFNVGLPDNLRIITGRDEYGTPIFQQKKKLPQTHLERANDAVAVPTANKVFDSLADTNNNQEDFSKGNTSGSKDGEGNVIDDKDGSPGKNEGFKSWSQVLKSALAHVNTLILDYCPLPEGKTVVSPPVEVLK
ncbi:hypothetical protein AgCh_032638 [Apium graveolens]